MYYCAKHFRNESLINKTKTGAVILVGGGDGNSDKAYDTACTILQHMNSSVIYEPIISHNTNICPAIDDSGVIEKLNNLAQFLNN